MRDSATGSVVLLVFNCGVFTAEITVERKIKVAVCIGTGTVKGDIFHAQRTAFDLKKPADFRFCPVGF